MLASFLYCLVLELLSHDTEAAKITVNTTFPPITCYDCGSRDVPSIECEDTPVLLKARAKTYDTAERLRANRVWTWTYDSNTRVLDGQVLPYKPYCATYLEVWGEKDMRIYLGRRGAWPSRLATSSRCVADEDPEIKLSQRWIYCDTDYCNTISKADMINECFKDMPGRSLELKNGTGSALRSATGKHDILGAALTLALSTIPASRSSRAAAILTVTLLLLRAVERSDGLKCYSCEDTGAVQTGSNLLQCYNTPALLAKTVECPDSITGANYMASGWTDRRNHLLRGYCAVWIQQTNYDISFGDRRDTYWNRGCQYPGGERNEPDDCLKVKEKSQPHAAWREWTVQYCRTDLCNGEPFADFVNRCFGGGGSNASLTTRDFNNVNATLQPPVSIQPLTIDPKIDALLKARAENLTANAGNGPKSGAARLTGFSHMDTLTTSLFLLFCLCACKL